MVKSIMGLIEMMQQARLGYSQKPRVTLVTVRRPEKNTGLAPKAPETWPPYANPLLQSNSLALSSLFCPPAVTWCAVGWCPPSPPQHSCLSQSIPMTWHLLSSRFILQLPEVTRNKFSSQSSWPGPWPSLLAWQMGEAGYSSPSDAASGPAYI